MTDNVCLSKSESSGQKTYFIKFINHEGLPKSACVINGEGKLMTGKIASILNSCQKILSADTGVEELLQEKIIARRAELIHAQDINRATEEEVNHFRQRLSKFEEYYETLFKQSPN